MNITHEAYFRRHKLSVEQYGEILVKVAYRGEKMPDHHKGYDVAATIAGKPARIEVKSKFAVTFTGDARVVHCGDTKFRPGGMTHLMVILVDDNEKSPSVKKAWLLT